MPHDLLIFLHIPKTGGTTLRWVLEAQHAPHSVYHCYGKQGCSEQELKDLPEWRKRQVGLVCTHLPFGTHALFPQAAQYVTMLRRPVERVISGYFSRATSPATAGLDAAVAAAQAESRDNRQVRLLAGVPDGRTVTTEDLERAHRRLRESFAAVGLTERFDESLALCARVLSLRDVAYVKRNVTRSRPALHDLPHALQDAIRRSNELDTLLYESAEELLDQQLQANRVTQSEVTALRRHPWRRTRAYASRAFRQLGRRRTGSGA